MSNRRAALRQRLRERRQATEGDESEGSDAVDEGSGRDSAEEAEGARTSSRDRQRPGLSRRLRERRSPTSQDEDSGTGSEDGGGRRGARRRARAQPAPSSPLASSDSDREAPAAARPSGPSRPRASDASQSQSGANWGLSTSDLPFGAPIAMDVDEDDLDGREQPALLASEVASFLTLDSVGAPALEAGALVAEASGGQRFLRAAPRGGSPDSGEDPDGAADVAADGLVSVPLLARKGSALSEATRARSCHMQQPPSGQFRTFSVPAYQRMRRAQRRRGAQHDENALAGKAGAGEVAAPNASVLKAATASVRVSLGMVFFVAQALLAGTAAAHYYLVLSYASDAAFVQQYARVAVPLPRTFVVLSLISLLGSADRVLGLRASGAWVQRTAGERFVLASACVVYVLVLLWSVLMSALPVEIRARADAGNEDWVSATASDPGFQDRLSLWRPWAGLHMAGAVIGFLLSLVVLGMGQALARQQYWQLRRTQSQLEEAETRVAVLQGEQLHTLSSEELRRMEESQAALIENVRNTLRAREELV